MKEREQFERRGPAPLLIESRLAQRRAEIERAAVERIRERRERPSERPIYIVREEVVEEYERRRDPKLKTFSGTNRVSDIRYDNVGNLLTATRQPRKTQILADGTRAFVNPNNISYKVVWPPRTREDYLNNLPKGRPVYQIALGESNILEKVIRRQKKVLKRYQVGESAENEAQFVRDVIEYSESMVLRFLTAKRVTLEDLQLLPAEAGRFLESVNLYDPRDPRKRVITDKMLAIGQPDRIGRPHYLGLMGKIFRTRQEAQLRWVAVNFIVETFWRNYVILTGIRETYRWRFDLAARQLEPIFSHPVFNRRNVLLTNGQREALNDSLIFVVENNLAVPKVSPYLKSARWAAINIRGCREDKKEANRAILGDQVADKLFQDPSVVDLVKAGQYFEARRKGMLSVRQLRKTNKKYEDIETAGKKT